jgi:hypothetical protein
MSRYMNASRNRFSFTRVASIAGGAAKNQIPISNFQLHRWSSGLTVALVFDTDCITEDQRFFQSSDPSQSPLQGLSCACGSGDKALQECNLSTGPSMDCSDCIPPGSGQFPDRVFAFSDASASHGPSEKLIVPPAVRPLRRAPTLSCAWRARFNLPHDPAFVVCPPVSLALISLLLTTGQIALPELERRAARRSSTISSEQ